MKNKEPGLWPTEPKTDYFGAFLIVIFVALLVTVVGFVVDYTSCHGSL